MQPVLLHQFRGALLGAALGEALGIYARQYPSTARPPIPFDRWLKSICLQGSLSLPWTQRLIEAGYRWINSLETGTAVTFPPLNDVEDLSHPDSSAIATILPAALLFQDNFNQYRQVCQPFHREEVAPETVLASDFLGRAIANVLCPVIEPQPLLIHLQQDWHWSESAVLAPKIQTTLEGLQKGYELLRQGANYEAIQASTLAIASPLRPLILAYLTVLGTPTDFSVSLLRTLHVQPEMGLTAITTGFLSGLYNTSTAIPASWTVALMQLPLTSMQNLISLADQLWATWAGADKPSRWSNIRHPTPPVVMPL